MKYKFHLMNVTTVVNHWFNKEGIEATSESEAVEIARKLFESEVHGSPIPGTFQNINMEWSE